ncbi:MAG: twin-arginine translocase TatA/TatE family subunit [Planctomycetes bacterium]|nr:twin-arginine translocase TatA/TatE family subunit [Planctomycetota bacterium]
MLGFLPSLGFQEMLVLAVIGLLLYGRNLPEAGRALGRVVTQLRRGFQEFKDQLDRDGSLREVKSTMRDAAQELKRVAEVPRAAVDPARALRDLTHEALSSPVPEAAPEAVREAAAAEAAAEPQVPPEPKQP